MNSSTVNAPPVWFVEDEDRLRQTLVSMAQAVGFEAVTGLPTAEAALRRLRDAATETPILVLDLNLPGMHGLDLLDRVYAERPDLPIIILTGFGNLEGAQRAIRNQVVDFLTKPCLMGELEQALNRAWLKLRRAPSLNSPADRPLLPSIGTQSLDEIEHHHILSTLQRHSGNRRAAAAELGISLRTLYYRLARYDENDPDAV